jgi:hypothetical protein
VDRQVQLDEAGLQQEHRKEANGHDQWLARTEEWRAAARSGRSYGLELAALELKNDDPRCELQR